MTEIQTYTFLGVNFDRLFLQNHGYRLTTDLTFVITQDNTIQKDDYFSDLYVDNDEDLTDVIELTDTFNTLGKTRETDDKASDPDKDMEGLDTTVVKLVKSDTFREPVYDKTLVNDETVPVRNLNEMFQCESESENIEGVDYSVQKNDESAETTSEPVQDIRETTDVAFKSQGKQSWFPSGSTECWD